MCSLGRLFVAKDSDICEIEALNRAGAGKGDMVRMEIGAQTALSAYLLAYGFPLSGFLLGSIIGGVMAPLFSLKDNALFISLFAFIGLGTCFAITVKKGKRFKAQPVIVEIITTKPLSIL